MGSTFQGIVLIAIGVVMLVQNIGLLRNPAKLARYVETSPKAALWRKKLGLERSIELSWRYFLPLGSAVAFGMIVLGASLFFAR